MIRLTPAQLRVLEEIKRGGQNCEIAARLFVTEKTIKFHLSDIYKAYGIGGTKGKRKRLVEMADA